MSKWRLCSLIRCVPALAAGASLGAACDASDNVRIVKAARGRLVVLGNAVLDHSIELDDLGCIPSGARMTTASQEFKANAVADVKRRHGVVTTVGGSALNTARVAGQLLRASEGVEVVFVGSVGQDLAAQFIEDECRRDGVTPMLARAPTGGTGECALLVHNLTRESTCICLRGAAGYMSAEVLRSKQYNQLFQSTTPGVLFSTAYNLTTQDRYEACKLLREKLTGCKLAFSLSSEDLLLKSATVKERLTEMLPHTSFVFGTKDELNAYFSVNGKKSTCTNENAMRLAGMIKSGGICLITDGPNQILVSQHQSDQLDHWPAPDVHKSKIVDTTGAGDSFAAGFLAVYLLGDNEQEKLVSKSIRSGFDAAQASLLETGIPRGIPPINKSS